MADGSAGAHGVSRFVPGSNVLLDALWPPARKPFPYGSSNTMPNFLMLSRVKAGQGSLGTIVTMMPSVMAAAVTSVMGTARVQQRIRRMPPVKRSLTCHRPTVRRASVLYVPHRLH